MSKRIYVAGPMRGYHNYNFAEFDYASTALMMGGWDVVSPADIDREVGFVTEVDGVVEITDKFSIEAALRRDLREITSCDAIALLAGWEDSAGTAVELATARALGLDVWLFDEGAMGFLRKMQTPTLIGIAGYARSGKDTLGHLLVDRHGFHRISFADALRDVLYATNPIVLPHLTRDNRVQDVVDVKGWERAKDEHPEIRRLLQALGTEGGRQAIDDDVWVDTAMRGVRPHGKYVFTDVRFPNEAQAIKDAGGVVIRLERPGFGPTNGHPSESALDGWDWDATILNDSTVEHLGGWAQALAAGWPTADGPPCWSLLSSLDWLEVPHYGAPAPDVAGRDV